MHQLSQDDDEPDANPADDEAPAVPRHAVQDQLPGNLGGRVTLLQQKSNTELI